METKSKKLDPIPIRLEPELKQALVELARADDRSLSAYVHRVLRQHVEALKGQARRSRPEKS